MVFLMNGDKSAESYEDVLSKLNEFRGKDHSFESGRALGSMCTMPHPIARKANEMFMDSNLGDPRLFPGCKEMETKYLDFVKVMLHAPSTASGHVVSGGTEGNMTAMWIAKTISEKKEIVVPESAHFSFQKTASFMNMKVKTVPVTKDHVMDVSRLQKVISSETAAVVGVAGSTELGMVDPIAEIAEICKEENIFLHVDAAFGGYVIPFLHELGYDVPEFDFTIEGVSSISVDTHKMGYGVIPLGAMILRHGSWLKDISVKAVCIDEKYQAGLLGTRSGGSVAAGYAVSRYIGMAGYKDVVDSCMAVTRHLLHRLENIGIAVTAPPMMNVVCLEFKDVDGVVDGLASRGWMINRISHLHCARIVLMPQITKEVIDEFIPILVEVCREVGEL